MSTAKATTDATFEADVLDSEKPVLVDFWADWCAPCRKVGPILDEIAAEHGDTITIVTLDTVANPDTTVKYGVIGLPALKVFVGGEVVKSMQGAKPKPAILKELAEFL